MEVPAFCSCCYYRFGKICGMEETTSKRLVIDRSPIMLLSLNAATTAVAITPSCYLRKRCGLARGKPCSKTTTSSAVIRSMMLMMFQRIVVLSISRIETVGKRRGELVVVVVIVGLTVQKVQVFVGNTGAKALLLLDIFHLVLFHKEGK